MISVDGDGGRRRRKVMELGFRSGGEEDMMMRGRSEVEEGEAGFIDLNNNNDDDDDDDDENNSSTIDPDVALSYLDEKLQDVLGHFQKDFEGGVSAENLGAKFGGYGSFLPSYQRSPSWSHPRTPTEYNQYGSRSIDNGQLQNYQTNSLYSSPDIISSNSVTRLRPASRIHQKNPLPNHGKQLTSKSELQNSTNSSDQKSWKVRIKVGKDELTSQKYADIYSGLGLDVSPSSSLNESPVESEGLHHDLPDIPDESLSCILQIMTSTALSGKLLLSPLSEELICLTEKEWITGERDPKTVDTANQGRSRTVSDGSDLKMTDRDIGNKPKSIKQSSSVSVSPTYNDKHISRAKSVVPKKENGLDCRSYDKLISSTMNLPLLADADGADLKKNSLKTKPESKVSAKGQVKSEAFSDVVERKVPEPVASFENGRANKNSKKSSVSGKAVASRKEKCSNEKIIPRKREVDCTVEEDELAMKNGEHVGQDEIPVRADTVHTPLQTVVEKKLDYGDDSLELDPGEAPSSSAHENRANGDPNIVAQDVMYSEDNILNNSPKSHQSKTSLSNSEDMMKCLGNTVDGYTECIEDVKLEKGRNNIETEETASIQAGKGSGVQEPRNLDKSINIPKDKSMGKNSVDLSPLDHQGLASNVSHYAGKCPNPNASTTAEAPLLNEDWVGCDKCHKWRILPLGTNPKSLPEKWVCSMLDWLPGMNHCDISQEDTTLASRAIQASISGSKQSLQPLSSKNISVVPTGDARRSIDDYQRSGIETHEVKMIHTVKDAAKGTNQEKSPSVGNSKKRLRESTKTRSLNDIDNSPSVNDFGNHHAGKASSLLEGSYSEENQSIPLQNHSDKDDMLKSKTKNKKDNEIDGKRASKKIKTGDIHLKDENPSDSRLPNIPSVNGHHDNNRFRISKGGIKNVSGSSERPEVLNSLGSDDGSQHLAVHRLDDIMKERKVNDAFKSDGNDIRLPGSKNRSSRSKDTLTEHHETDERTPKKARISKSEGKDHKRQSDYSGSPKNISRGTKDILGQDLVSTAFQRGTDAVEPLRKDLGLMQPSVAATSSSSKVSGSLRSKAGLNETKDSPIESVSSSPLRAPGVGHFNHTKRDVTPHHDDVGFFQQASRPSPKISSHDEPIFDTDQTGKIRSDEKMHHLEGVKNKIETSPHFTAQVNDCNVRSTDQVIQNARQMETLSQNHDEKREKERNVSRHSGHSKKTGKGSSSSRSKDKKHVSRSVCDNGKVSHSDPIDVPLYEEKIMAGSNKSQGMRSVSSDRTDKSHVSKKDSSVDCKGEIPTKVGVHDATGGDAITRPDVNQKVVQNSETGKSSRSLHSDKAITGVSEKGKSSTKQPSLRGQSESTTNVQPIVELKKENDCANDHDEQSNALKQPKRPEKPTVNHQTSTRNSNSSIHKGRAVGESKDSLSQAVTNAIKEAKDLKHLADRLKHSGSTESTGLYFQAALKFLHGACLLESCSNENGKQPKIQSMEMYSSTAKLCEFCAHEYEKSKDMASAALAYKCVEVAYMRVIYTSHTGVNKVRNEVQTALQLVPTGDSPSSSASDIDNLNNAAIVDKAIASKGVDSPQVAGTQVITARNRSSCLHLIRFAQEVTFAMEASRKSRSRLGEVQNKEGISSVKRALDFNFQDVEGLLHLVRVAMEAINR